MLVLSTYVKPVKLRKKKKKKKKRKEKTTSQMTSNNHCKWRKDVILQYISSLQKYW